jgi:hypothetical protein
VTDELIATIILQAPSVAGLVVAVYFVGRELAATRAALVDITKYCGELKRELMELQKVADEMQAEIEMLEYQRKG